MTKSENALNAILLDEWERMDSYEPYDIREKMEETVENIILAPSAVYWMEYRKKYNVTPRQLREVAEKSGQATIDRLLNNL